MRLRFAAAVAVLAGSTAALAGLPERYTITDLGTLGGPWSNAYGLNNAGTVVGIAELPNEASVAAVWIDGVPTGITGFFNDGPAIRASGINNAGQVVGSANAPSLSGPGAVTVGFVWTQAGGSRELRVPGINNPVAARAINNVGQIAGGIEGGPMTGPYVWTFDEGGTPVAQRLEIAGAFSGFSNRANAINDNGIVVGAGWREVSVNGGTISGFRPWAYDLATGLSPDLGTLGANTGEAHAINNSNQIVGTSGVPGAPPRATLWLPVEGEPLAWQPVDLGVLPGFYDAGQARGINSAGVIVGDDFSNGTFGIRPQGWIWKDGVKRSLEEFLDINDLVAWQIYYAFGINDSGQIAGVGVHNGETRAFLMTPVNDTACPADFNADGEVNTADITAYLSAWFADRAAGTAGPGDFDRDGAVTTADITAFLSAWFNARAGGC